MIIHNTTSRKQISSNKTFQITLLVIFAIALTATLPQQASASEWKSSSSVVSGLGVLNFMSTPSVFRDGDTWKLISGEQGGVFYGYQWNGSEWASNNSIVAGLTDIGSSTSPTVYRYGGTWNLISGEYDGVFNGYQWNGTAWVNNSGVVSGLTDIGRYSSPSVFEDGGILKLISGEYDGLFYGYQWNGSAWVSNSSIVNGLSATSNISSPSVFKDGDTWKLISGKMTGLFDGYSWNGTSWVSNSSIISGLSSAVGGYTSPSVFQDGLTWKIIYGTFSGDFYGYILDETPDEITGTWIENPNIVTGLGDVGTYSTPTSFQENGKYYLISGGGNGFLNGYNWNGSSWITNSSIVSGLGDLGDSTKPVVFNHDNTLKLISSEGVTSGHYPLSFYWNGTSWISNQNISSGLSGYLMVISIFDTGENLISIIGTNSGTFIGYYWNDSSWVSYPKISTGLGDVGFSSAPTIFKHGSVVKMISGAISGGFVGYYWNGTSWVTNNSVKSGLGGVDSSSVPFVYEYDSVLTLISGDINGTFTGYYLDDSYPSLSLSYHNNISGGQDYLQNQFTSLFLYSDSCGYGSYSSSLLSCNGSFNHTLKINISDEYIDSINITTDSDWNYSYYSSDVNSTSDIIIVELNVSERSSGTHWLNTKVCDHAGQCTNHTYYWHKPTITFTNENSYAVGETGQFLLNLTFNTTFGITGASGFAHFNDTNTSGNFSLLSQSTAGGMTTHIYGYNYTFDSSNDASVPVNITWGLCISNHANSCETANISGYPSDYFQTAYYYSTNITMEYVYLSNCSDPSHHKILTFYGYDEETSGIVSDMRLNIDVSAYVNPFVTVQFNTSFDGQSNYSICIFPNASVIVNAILEYGDTPYTDRKYYIVDAEIAANETSTINLYHLNDSKASEIVYYAYEKGSSQPLDDVYIKIQRYYPETSSYKTVEIEKTDDTGYALGKMVLSDIFYRYIVEYPSGTVRILSDVQKVLSLTRNFPISLGSDALSDWNKLGKVSVSTTCTKGTDICRFQWVDSTNVVASATLEIYRDTGISKVKIYSQSVSSSSGSIVYTINESTAGKSYEAVGFVESSDGSRIHDTDELNFAESFASTPREKIQVILPLVIGIIFLSTLMLDMGAMGVVFGSLIGFSIGGFAMLIPVPLAYIISIIILGGILLFKLSRTG